MTTVAFYLPQFAPSPENDKWWGTGFTEWTLVARARPLFHGHRQPRLPGELGFYDLRVPAVRQTQAQLARSHDIDAFCYYHYWSLGRRLLGRVLDDVLRSGQPDFPFCLSWANHPWSRRWDGSTDQLLFDQRYSPSDDVMHSRWLAEVFAAPRYLHHEGRPVFLVHWAHHHPVIGRFIEALRQACAGSGGPDPYVLRVESADEMAGVDPTADGFDGSVQWHPRGELLGRLRLGDADAEDVREAAAANVLVDYSDYVSAATSDPRPVYPHHQVVFPSWDNSPRRSQGHAAIVQGSPSEYGRWLEWATQNSAGLLFVNAWNEWSEGAVLEPDADIGRAYLQAHIGRRTRA